MEKWGIVFDSSCGFSKEEVEKNGNFFVSLIVTVNDKNYKAGENLSSNELSAMMQDKNVNVKTSAVLMGDFANVFKEGLKKYEKLIFIGLSKHFSSTQNTANLVIKNNSEFQGRVFVYDSTYSAPWTNVFYNDIIKIVKSENDFEKIKEKLDFQSPRMVGYLTPGSIYWLYKGGRISRQQYITANLLKIKPILTVKNGKIMEHVYKIRTVEKCIKKMIELCNTQVQNAIREKLEYQYCVLEVGNNEFTLQIIKEILKANKNLKKDDIKIINISAEQTAHLGPNSYGITIKTLFP